MAVQIARKRNKPIPATQDVIDVLDVADDYIILKNFEYRAVARVSTINFYLKSDEEKEAILAGFRAFIDSIPYPIQILIQSRKLDISSYLANLREKFAERGEEAKEIAGSELSFVKQLVEKNKILQKFFYIVIPFKGEAEEAERELNLRFQLSAKALEKCGLKVHRIEGEEIVDLLTEANNGAGKGELAINKIAPQTIDSSNSDHYKLGDMYVKTFLIPSNGYPEKVFGGWLSRILDMQESFDFSIHIHPADSSLMAGRLARDIKKLRRTTNYDQYIGKNPDMLTNIKLVDAEELLNALLRGSEKIFDVSFYLTTRATSKKKLDQASKAVQMIFSSMLLRSHSANFQQEKAFKSVLPIGRDYLHSTRNFNSSCLSACFPFISSELSAKNGIIYGINKHNNTLVTFDRFSLENANQIVFAKSGAGKSFAVKLDTIRNWLCGADVIVIDPENEFTALAVAVGGQVIELSASSKDIINPCEIKNIKDLRAKSLYLQGLFATMLAQSVSGRTKSIFDKAITQTYEKKKEVYLADIIKEIEGLGAKDASLGLERFIRGSYSGLFNGKTNVELNNSFTVINIQNLEEELRPVAMYVILGWIWEIIRKNPKKRILVSEETWQLLQYPDTARFLKSFAKRARKYYLGLTTITQDVEDVLNNPDGIALATNSSMQFLLKQSAQAIDKITEAFKLSFGERALLLSCDIGEGLLFAGNEHVALKIKASSDMYKLITTDPTELFEDEDV